MSQHGFTENQNPTNILYVTTLNRMSLIFYSFNHIKHTQN